MYYGCHIIELLMDEIILKKTILSFNSIISQFFYCSGKIGVDSFCYLGFLPQSSFPVNNSFPLWDTAWRSWPQSLWDHIPLHAYAPNQPKMGVTGVLVH